MINSLINTLIVGIISILGAYTYNYIYIDNSILISDFITHIDSYILFIAYILVISFISDYFYSSSKESDKKTLSISLGTFKYISQLIRLSSVYIAINCLLVDNFFGYEFHDNVTFIYIGITLSAISISLFLSAKISLGSNYSDCYNQKDPKNLVSTGLYSIIRHPIYTSNILLILSVLIISGSYIIFINLLIMSFFYAVSAFREERYLVSRFPSYSKYSRKTGMFIPKYWK